MPLQKLLEQLNIHEREAQVYIALLQLGLTGVGPIVTKTKLHRMLVYQSLEKLKDMHMASMVMKSGRQHWQATNPSVILDRVHRQEDIAKQAVAELEKLRQKSQEDLSVQILYGRQGLIENLQASLESAAHADKIVRIIGGANGNRFYELLGAWYTTYLELQKRLGTTKQLIVPSNESEQIRQNYASEPGNELRFMPSGITSPTFTRITQEMVSIEVCGVEPVIIQIRNKTIAHAFLESFKLLWEQGTTTHQ